MHTNNIFNKIYVFINSGEVFTKKIETIRTIMRCPKLVRILEIPKIVFLIIRALMIPIISVKIKNIKDIHTIGTEKILSKVSW